MVEQETISISFETKDNFEKERFKMRFALGQRKKITQDEFLNRLLIVWKKENQEEEEK